MMIMSDIKTFDLIVIRTGAAASAVARKCHSAGWSVAVIDSRPFGGTCTLRGCDPKKVLVGAAEVIDLNQRMEKKGIINSNSIKILWPDLMRFKRSFTDPVPMKREEQFSKAGIITYHGRARFVARTTIKIDSTTSITPAISWPGTLGYWIPGNSPSLVKESLWQMPHACTLMPTCLAAGSGISLSTISSGPLGLETWTERIFYPHTLAI
jgi:hypothetical protein